MNSLARSTISPEALAEKWNKTFAIGTPVRYWVGAREGFGNLSSTRSLAQVLGGHTAVVWIEGRGDCIALSHVEPVLQYAGSQTMKNDALVFHCKRKRWNELLDDILAATGVRSMFQKNKITAIVIENGSGVPCRFVLEEVHRGK